MSDKVKDNQIWAAFVKFIREMGGEPEAPVKKEADDDDGAERLVRTFFCMGCESAVLFKAADAGFDAADVDRMECPECAGVMKASDGADGESILKPAPDETDKTIRWRMKNPDLFKEGSFRTITLSKDKGIKSVVGRLKKAPKGSSPTTTHLQSYVFAKEKGWTVDKARAWIKGHKSLTKGAPEAQKAVWDAYVADVEELHGAPSEHYLHLAGANDEGDSLWCVTDPWGRRYYLYDGSKAASIAVRMDRGRYHVETPNAYLKAEDLAKADEAEFDRLLCEALVHGADPHADRFEREIQVVFKDDEQRLVLGVVLEPGVEDADGDLYTPAEVEKACHRFNLAYFHKGSAATDLKHAIPAPEGVIPVESYVAPSDLVIKGPLGKHKVRKGTWLMMMHADDDDVWDGIKGAEYTGFSIEGTGLRTPRS